MINCYHRKNKKGFTLIELLVVISIISLLTSIILASITDARKKARDSRRIQDLRQIVIALELYRDKNGHYPYCSSISSGGSLNCDGTWVTSDSTSHWSTLESTLTEFIKLPKDPVNNGTGSGTGWWADLTNKNHAYAYLSEDLCNAGQCYNLYTRLENESNYLACGNKNPARLSRVGNALKLYWDCTGTSGNMIKSAYEPQLPK